MANIENHFENKKNHTEIKHKIFNDTLKAILAISDVFSKYNESFIYIDLYAGEGKFSDNTFGSPLLALDTFYSAKNISLNFKSIKCIFVEKNNSRVEELKKNIKDKVNYSILNNLELNVINDCWINHKNNISKVMETTKWGLIFIDPFHNEVELEELFILIKNKANLIDFLIFINIQSLKRLAGNKNTQIYVQKFLNLNEVDIPGILENNEKINEILQKRFSDISKSFILNANIPTTRNNKLINSDTFQLLLGTNSIGVADNFLISFVDAIKDFKEDTIFNLFNNLEDEILNHLKNYNELTIFELIRIMFRKYNSWKNADINNIATSENLFKSINDLIKCKKITFITKSEILVNKKNKLLKKEVFRKNQNMKQISLKYVN